MDYHRGTHSLPISDLNEDGKEEILWGNVASGGDGNDLWAIKEKIPYRGHPDVVLAAHIMPSQKGSKSILLARVVVGRPKKKECTW